MSKIEASKKNLHYLLTLCLELYEDEPCQLEPFIRKMIEESDETESISPSPSLNEAAEARKILLKHVSFTDTTEGYHIAAINEIGIEEGIVEAMKEFAGWNAREAQGAATISKTERVQEAAEVKPFELMKFPGEKGSCIHDHNDASELETLLRKAMDKGEIPANVTNAFEEWLKSAGIKLNTEERNVASIIFFAGIAHHAAQTGVWLTKELFDSIWEAAIEWKVEQITISDFSEAPIPTEKNPDKETFWKSLNL